MTIRVGLIRDDSGRTLDPALAKVLAGAITSVERMLNDRELVARVDKMYYESAGLMRDAIGFDWYGPGADVPEPADLARLEDDGGPAL